MGRAGSSRRVYAVLTQHAPHFLQCTLRYISLTFIDFLEAIGRVADMKSLPLESELEGAGVRGAGGWGGRQGGGAGRR